MVTSVNSRHVDQRAQTRAGHVACNQRFAHFPEQAERAERAERAEGAEEAERP